MNRKELLIKKLSKQLGFNHCGISKAVFLEDEAPRLEQWLSQNMHGQMSYMANHFDKRLDPRILVPGAKSIISLLLNYFPEKEQNSNAPKISRYAFGRDYHKVLKKKMKLLVAQMQAEFGDFDARIFVDSAPVMDKVWAAKSGLGWIGKHTNLINKQQGSYFFVAEIICDLDLEPDAPIKDFCGTCTKCIDACPTNAIVAPYVVDGSKCISYYTIELKEAIPEEARGKMDNWMFGCDVCQEVCPWNRFSTPTKEPDFNPRLHTKLSTEDWLDITEEVFNKMAEGTPLKRAGFEGIKRNLTFL
ncbi:MAG: tRNA epoxyqueuosine(34) reductase QueG [Bacteroidetes bacterium]|nr:tRNA epoxyqueuosine(34) reductase QueG [Bacteroidota bacterium]